MASMYTDWLDSVLSQCSGADKPIAEHEMEKATRTFFEESLVWQEEVALTSVPTGQDYDLNTDSAITALSGKVVYIMELYIGDKYIPATTYNAQTWDQSTNTQDNFITYYCPNPSTIHYMPDITAALTNVHVRVAMTPETWKTDIAAIDFVKTHYYDAVLAGMLGNMMVHPDKTYTDDKRADYYLRKFKSECAKLRDMSNRRFTRRSPEFVFNTMGWNSSFPKTIRG